MFICASHLHLNIYSISLPSFSDAEIGNIKLVEKDHFFSFKIQLKHVRLILWSLKSPSRHCDIWWPLRGAPARAVLTLRAAINVELFTLQVFLISLHIMNTQVCKN